jgi:hypothetical protein
VLLAAPFPEAIKYTLEAFSSRAGAAADGV